MAQAQIGARCAAMVVRRAAAALQDAFSVWAAYAAALSPDTAIHEDDAFLAPRDSEVRSGSSTASSHVWQSSATYMRW